MRRFALVEFDIDNKIIDRINIDIAVDPSGFGFKFKMSTIAGDVEDIITKMCEEKLPKTFEVIHRAGYYGAHALSAWVSKHARHDVRMGLEYDDGTRLRYCEGKVLELSKGELDQFRVLNQALKFQPITPLFMYIENTIRIQMSSQGKSYPFRYPYCYGKSIVENNEINNTYITDVPVTVKIFGAIANPQIHLIDAAGEAYNIVSFPAITLAEKEFILINSSDCKIWLWKNNKYIDIAAETDPRYDLYLRAKEGVSKLSVNLSASDSGSVIGAWRQYGI